MNSANSLYKVEPSFFEREIFLPTSKSHANRALIIGAIRGNGFRIHQLPMSSDVTTMLACLKAVGLTIVQQGDALIFKNSFPACEADKPQQVIDLKTGDGGTTNRFLMALLSRGQKTYRFFPSEKMSERPIDDLIQPLRGLQVEIELDQESAWLSLKGPAVMVNGSKLEINCEKSTQFASAMMLAFSTLPLTIELKNVKASETYILMTKAILKETLLKNSYTIPVDFSSLSYPLALALMKGRVLVKNCFQPDPLQSDSQLIKIMKDCGGDIEWTEAGLLITSKNKLSPFNVDGSYFPDLVPTLAFIASRIKGKSVIKNLAILRHKESDRLEQVIMLLKKFGVPFLFDESHDEISIEGSTQVTNPVNITPARDHRMVMTAYLFLRANGGGMLSEADCVLKSFPNFFTIMENK